MRNIIGANTTKNIMMFPVTRENSKFESYFYDCIVSKFSELSEVLYCSTSHLYDMTNPETSGKDGCKGVI